MPEAAAVNPPASAVDPSWSQVWQLPVLMLGVALFASGIYLAIPEREPNDFPGRLKDIAYYLEASNFEEAKLGLDTIVRNLGAPDATDEDRATFHQYQADLLYLQMHATRLVNVDTPGTEETNRKIIGGYAKAEELGRKLDGKSFRRYADTLVALGKEAEALKLVDRMTDEPASRRYAIVRSLVDRQRQRKDARDYASVMPLIERFKRELRTETDPQRRRGQELWAAALESQMQLEAGDPQGTIDALLVRLQRFTGQGGDGDLAELYVLLAEAYQMVGDAAGAERYYRFAQQKLPADSGLNAEILLGLGQIALLSTTEDSVQLAMENFAQSVQQYPSERAYIESLIGLADCEARQGEMPLAIEHFGQAIERLVESTPAWDERRDMVMGIVRSHMERAVDQAAHDLALDLLTLLLPLYDKLPADMLLRFATIHRAMADDRKAYAAALEAKIAAGDGQVGLDAVRLANQQSGMHYEQAGVYFLQHAAAITVTDDEAHGTSLWQAAQSFDRAQDWTRTIEVLAEFIETRQTDSRRLAATQALGMAYLADGQYAPAAQLFLQLVEHHPHSPETFDSLVPLARADIGLGRLDAAERTLLQVVTDHPAITPDSAQYQQALIELGKLYYRLGERDGDYHVLAIERLEEAVERYGDSADGPTLRYLLADTYRVSVETLNRRLADRQSQADRLAQQAERSRRLEKAQMYFSQVANELEARPESTLSALEILYRRNAYFYQGDCAYDRGQYEDAIRLYDNAARRWEHDPASLVALVQIVNAYCELGQYPQAKVANETARWQLQRMPEEAFKDATLPMSRQHWEDWLRWTSELDLYGGAARPRTSPARNTN